MAADAPGDAERCDSQGSAVAYAMVQEGGLSLRAPDSNMTSSAQHEEVASVFPFAANPLHPCDSEIAAAAHQAEIVPPSPMTVSCARGSTSRSGRAERRSLGTRSTSRKSDRLTPSTYADEGYPINDAAIDDIAERVGSRLHDVLTELWRESFAAGMAPLEKAVEELRALSQRCFLVAAGDVVQHQQRSPSNGVQSKKQYRSEPISGGSGHEGGGPRLPIPRRVLSPQRGTSGSARSDGQASAGACHTMAGARDPSTNLISIVGKAEQLDSVQRMPSTTPGANTSARAAGSPAGRRKVGRAAGRTNTPSEASHEQQQHPTSVDGSEQRQAAAGINSGRTSPRQGGRRAFSRRPSLSEPRCVQSLMADIADAILQDDGLLNVPDTSKHGRDRGQRPASEADNASHDGSAASRGTAVEKQLHGVTPNSPDAKRHQGGSADGDYLHLFNDLALVDSGSDPGSATPSLSPPSPATPTRLRQVSVEEYVQTIDPAAPCFSRGRYVRTDHCLCSVMRAGGVLPWSVVDDKREFWRQPGVWYQWFIVLLVFGACGLCVWAQPGLVMDIPLIAGTCLGLLSLRTYSGSTELHQCQELLRGYASRGGSFSKWMRFARRDLGCSVLVGAVAVVLRFLGEGLTIHSLLCAFVSAVLMSLTYSILYVCRAAANIVDQYSMRVFKTPATDQNIFDWNVVQSVLRKASGVLQRSVFVLQAAAVGAMVSGLIDVMRGALTGFAQYASFASWALVTLDLSRILFTAAAVTDKCMMVPSLMSQCSDDMDPKRQYVLQHIVHAKAGFYVFEVLLDSALAFKIAYMTCAVGFVVASKLAVAPLTNACS